ncbi:hypothetical protein [Photobacterium lucens]|nr:hypothetical protein [Photobacterium lucens]MBP2701064.1 hypothetical protein [Vibrio parahaemolyticus]MZG56277.1 hypothetical protein [Photobacterium lucens]MZG82202.1 hypothetical protein [Photobacterium lucens]PSV21970.1 hypothetical protein C0W44_07155 [Photobacterium leiognathi subsp. mandapamensis]
MKMCVIASIISIILLISFPSGARSFEQYVEQYNVLPCEGLKVKQESLKKRAPMIKNVSSNKEIKTFKNQQKAVSYLIKKKKCSSS